MKLITLHEGLFNKAQRNPLYDNQEYGAAFAALVKKHNGDEKAAEAELKQLASTPYGRFQLMRVGAIGTPPAQEPDMEKETWRAHSTSGRQMFGGR